MIGIDDLLRHYLDDVECLQAVQRLASATPGALASKRFGGLTPQQLADRLKDVRAELDKAFVLTMIASGEGSIRRDFLARVNLAATARAVQWRRIVLRFRLDRVFGRRLVTLEDRLVDLQVRYRDRVKLENILDAWKQSGADAQACGDHDNVRRTRRSAWQFPPLRRVCRYCPTNRALRLVALRSVVAGSRSSLAMTLPICVCTLGHCPLLRELNVSGSICDVITVKPQEIFRR